MRHTSYLHCPFLTLFLLSVCATLALTSCRERHYHVAVSQCYHNAWNLQLSRDLQREADSHPEIDLDINMCHGGTAHQIADVRQFIAQHVDALIISPNEEDSLRPVIHEALSAGIPVIVVNSTPSIAEYTSIIQPDNYAIGRRGGDFVLNCLPRGGTYLELQGVPGSVATSERHRGFHEVIDGRTDIVCAGNAYTDWSYDSAVPLIDSLITLHPDIDVIAAQCDPVALAAYDICLLHQISPMPAIIGIDALMGEGNGIQAIIDGKLSGSCFNPTGGMEAMRTAINILERQPYERNVVLPTQFIDQDNVLLYVQQEERIEALTGRIEEINSRMDHYFERSNVLGVFITVGGLLLLISIAFIFYVLRSVRQRAALRQKVEDATQAKLDFFTNVSHSFRTPLTIIADPIHILRSEGGLNERQSTMLEMMEHQTGQLIQLTDKVLHVLQDDLLHDGQQLDAIAQQTVNASVSAADLRNKSTRQQPTITTREERNAILIIDDNAEIRQYLSMILEKQHYLVLAAPNGEEGLLLARQNIPDLIICDVMMPVMDGLECCRLLKADFNTCHIPVLMLTAYGLDDQRIQGYQSGADAYIVKPFNSDVLIARIANLIASRKRFDPTRDRAEQLANDEFCDPDRSFINHLYSFISMHITDGDLGIQQLCQEFNVSHVQLYRKCKSLSGLAPTELVRAIRLKEARHQLESSDKPISQIAYETGFSSPSYFAKCFKDQYKLSPTDIQRRSKV